MMRKRSYPILGLGLVVSTAGLLLDVRLLQFLGGLTMLLVFIGEFAPDRLLGWGLRPGDDARRGQDRFGRSARR